MNRKRILIFSVAYTPFVGGAEIAVREITSRIHDIEFEMITLNVDSKQKSEEQVGNVKIYRIGSGSKISKLFFPFNASRFANKLHAEKKYDAVWSIMASYSGFAALFFKKKNDDVPFILTLQEGDPIDFIKRQVWFVYPWFKQIFNRANKIQAISTFLANFAKDMGAKVEPVVIPNGVDIATFTKPISEEKKQELKAVLNKKDGDVYLVTTSRLVLKNAVSDVITALTHLPEHVKFLVLGDGKLKEDLNKQVLDLKLEDRVIFAGEVEYKNIPEYLAISDIFIRPSLSEGMGNSFIEAMASGIPVIATRVGGIPDFLKDRETGLFCEVQNPESIAEKVKELIDDKALYQKLKNNGHSLVVEKYDWGRIAQEMKAQVFDK